MKKVAAVLRSLVLAVLLVLALWNTPFEVFGSGESMVQVRRVRGLVQAAWIAIAWIGIETAIAWFRALRKPKAPKAPKEAREAQEPAAAPAPAAEPPAPAGDEPKK